MKRLPVALAVALLGLGTARAEAPEQAPLPIPRPDVSSEAAADDSAEPLPPARPGPADTAEPAEPDPPQTAAPQPGPRQTAAPEEEAAAPEEPTAAPAEAPAAPQPGPGQTAAPEEEAVASDELPERRTADPEVQSVAPEERAEAPATPTEIQGMPPPEDPDMLASCVRDLAQLQVAFERMEAIQGEGACGAARPLRVAAVGDIEIRPPAVVRCAVARSLALWIHRVVAPLSQHYQLDRLTALQVGTDYQCRERRGGDSAMLSEHAFANAIDIHGFVFESGSNLLVGNRSGAAEPDVAFQSAIRGGACALFTTVLGPGSNAAHGDHLHLDMAERGGGYRVCE